MSEAARVKRLLEIVDERDALKKLCERQASLLKQADIVMDRTCPDADRYRAWLADLEKGPTDER